MRSPGKTSNAKSACSRCSKASSSSISRRRSRKKIKSSSSSNTSPRISSISSKSTTKASMYLCPHSARPHQPHHLQGHQMPALPPPEKYHPQRHQARKYFAPSWRLITEAMRFRVRPLSSWEAWGTHRVRGNTLVPQSGVISWLKIWKSSRYLGARLHHRRTDWWTAHVPGRKRDGSALLNQEILGRTPSQPNWEDEKE